jgi:hypothetical protein
MRSSEKAPSRVHADAIVETDSASADADHYNGITLQRKAYAGPNKPPSIHLQRTRVNRGNRLCAYIQRLTRAL